MSLRPIRFGLSWLALSAAFAVEAPAPVGNDPTPVPTAVSAPFSPVGDGWTVDGVLCDFQQDGSCARGTLRGFWRVEGARFTIAWSNGTLETYAVGGNPDELTGATQAGETRTLRRLAAGASAAGKRGAELEPLVLGTWDWMSAPGNRVTFTPDHRGVENLGSGGTTGLSWRVDDDHVVVDWDVGYHIEMWPTYGVPAWVVFAVGPDGNRFTFIAKRVGFWPKPKAAADLGF